MAYGNKNALSGFGGEAEAWSRERFRQYQITQLENLSMEAEEKNDYGKVLRVSRLILRLQMELMTEKTTDEQGRKITLKGTKTTKFQNTKEKIKYLEKKLKDLSKATNDPQDRYNKETEREELYEAIKELSDELSENNTELGLNYQQKDVYEAWKE